MKVYVRNEDLGFWTQTEVPVTILERIDEDETEITYCNHGGAETETVENSMYRPDHDDIVWEDRVTVCRKCGAYRMQGEDDWQDAPVNGKR